MTAGAFDTTDPFVRAQRLEHLAATGGAALRLYARQWSDSPEDIVQEAFIQLARQHTWPDDPLPWLYRVVRNRAISVARSNGRRQRREVEALQGRNTWFTPSDGETIDSLAATDALRQLPEDQRETVVAHLWGSLSFEQIAAVAGGSATAARRRYHTALAALRERLGLT